jgi:ubiquinone/menaquinone biosynthesis C-methylase UbiE
MRRLALFALLAPVYDRIFASLNLDKLQEVLELPGSGSLLDLGGGTGRVSAPLVSATTKVIVTDPSAPMLRQATKKRGLYPVCADAERLPFPGAGFERILVVDAFHHFHDHEEAVLELLRVLAPGGRLVLEEPNIERWPVKIVSVAERLALMRSRFFGPEDMRLMFERRGAHVTVYTKDAITVWLVVDKARDA